MQLGKVSDEKSIKQISLSTNEDFQMLYLNAVTSTVLKVHDFIDNKLQLKESKVEKKEIAGEA